MTATSLPAAVSRAEWTAARQELLRREQELAVASEAVNEARRALPMVEVDAEYAFTGADGPARLIDLFEGRRQLIVYHFMFGANWDHGCPHCSMAADNFGHLAHYHGRETTLAVVSLADYGRIAPFKARMGWTFPWYSSAGTTFNTDFNATVDGDEMPGVSTFLRDGDTVFHTYTAGVQGGADFIINTHNYLNMTHLGPQADKLRHHDRY